MTQPWPPTDTVLAHFLDAVDDDDDGRIERILAKVQRSPESVIAEVDGLFRAPIPAECTTDVRRSAVAGAYELLREVDTEAAVDATLRALSRTPADLPRADRVDFESMSEEVARRPGTLVRETALRLHAAATADGDVDLARTCLDVIARFGSLDEDALALLTAACVSDPVHALGCLSRASDRVVADLVVRTARALGQVNTLDMEQCAAIFYAMRRLTELGVDRSFEDVSFTTAAGERLLKLQGRRLERLEAQLDRSAGKFERNEPGPNAPCPCGSGRKTKRCCG